MQYTPEQQADVASRAEGFMKEFQPFYQGLKDKYECELVYTIAKTVIAPGVFADTIQENVGDLKFKPAEAAPEGIVAEG